MLDKTRDIRVVVQLAETEGVVHEFEFQTMGPSGLCKGTPSHADPFNSMLQAAKLDQNSVRVERAAVESLAASLGVFAEADGVHVERCFGQAAGGQLSTKDNITWKDSYTEER